MEKKTICIVDIAKWTIDSIIHTLQNCTWTKHYFFGSYKVVKRWKCTSLCFSQIEIMFGRKSNQKKKKKNAELYFVRKLIFTLLYAKYYSYNIKLSHGKISIFDFIANFTHKYSKE